MNESKLSIQKIDHRRHNSAFTISDRASIEICRFKYPNQRSNLTHYPIYMACLSAFANRLDHDETAATGAVSS